MAAQLVDLFVLSFPQGADHVGKGVRESALASR
jgi:hypothetical protein